ncbi:protein kinase C and casein kinase substrate in neurons protein 1 [Rhinopithecus roxellana]|uniref:Protein kinase C and casein kinase substrate in neurons protein 1 n=2 Tax=Rhinopithecus TaxID=542827 RepID=A0AAJ7GGN9_RHIBE|nr:protein kinase C and casein kinase substrate in neurons protein 1 [Rhinopithecus roxellana]XP_017709153.1 PREDICTED: protein kinase C and casein kinase substrate in neurons protein 1 isoform X1 [Rhinopithecus bieti]XP_017709154.1 PREDICTED: protein kinase C and casein kinase substrate in neurons protein 1 isoform X1 [Rhinopithecus bieti]XP_017709155.1 PREDICTED: protein kinase C and casein kinase substrate in neurons protein 1 isoform X1 [Rhinopithecus bieti]XP_030785133.1 protein kinase C a
MSGSYDEASLAPEETTDSFWEVGNYKRTVKRIDDGHRLCNDLMNCVQERAKIEKAYGQQLTDWAKRWRQLIEKGPQYGSLERAWGAIMTEADKVSELHQEVKNNLLNEDLEKVKNWQKDAYHKQIMGGFKETKEAEDGFRKAQKPWAKKMKELEAAKKAYHLACKEEKLAMTREMNSKTEQSVTPEQQKKLQDKVDKCKQDVQKTQEKYEKVLEDVGKTTPQYMENMEQVFEQCQQFEEKRLVFLKEVLLDIKRHLNLAENSSYIHVYRELEQAIRGADAQEDLRWFRSTSGPGMPMNWPQFEEWNPDLPHTTTKKERQSKKAEGVVLTNATGAVESTSQAGDRGSVSSYDRGQPYATEWSDDESGNPFGGSEANGGANPFEDDSKGVRVRALYDYDGQEQDELSFKAGDELTKLGEEDEQGWCRGRLDSGQLGLYPANYVEAI